MRSLLFDVSPLPQSPLARHGLLRLRASLPRFQEAASTRRMKTLDRAGIQHLVSGHIHLGRSVKITDSQSRHKFQEALHDNVRDWLTPCEPKPKAAEVILGQRRACGDDIVDELWKKHGIGTLFIL